MYSPIYSCMSCPRLLCLPHNASNSLVIIHNYYYSLVSCGCTTNDCTNIYYYVYMYNVHCIYIYLSVKVRKVMETSRLHSQFTVVAMAMAVLRAQVG